MTRFRFILAALGIGIAKGQTRYQAYTDPDWKQCQVPGGELDRTGRPEGCGHGMPFKLAKNGQCPIPGCGTMAPPYHRPLGLMHMVHGNADGTSNAVPGEPYGPTEQLVRCARCNAAFWQDAV